MTTVIAHAARSGIAALNVVTAALDTDLRTRDVPVVFARGRSEVAAAIANANTDAIVAWSFYTVDAARVAADLAWLRANAPPALHVAGGVHATADSPTANGASNGDGLKFVNLRPLNIRNHTCE